MRGLAAQRPGTHHRFLQLLADRLGRRLGPISINPILGKTAVSNHFGSDIVGLIRSKIVQCFDGKSGILSWHQVCSRRLRYDIGLDSRLGYAGSRLIAGAFPPICLLSVEEVFGFPSCRMLLTVARLC